MDIDTLFLWDIEECFWEDFPICNHDKIITLIRSESIEKFSVISDFERRICRESSIESECLRRRRGESRTSTDRFIWIGYDKSNFKRSRIEYIRENSRSECRSSEKSNTNHTVEYIQSFRYRNFVSMRFFCFFLGDSVY